MLGKVWIVAHATESWDNAKECEDLGRMQKWWASRLHSAKINMQGSFMFIFYHTFPCEDWQASGRTMTSGRTDEGHLDEQADWRLALKTKSDTTTYYNDKHTRSESIFNHLETQQIRFSRMDCVNNLLLQTILHVNSTHNRNTILLGNLWRRSVIGGCRSYRW